ncbi:hypothetical protein DFH08DRAFT_874603 [Mycena albidolilacea]|uniref:C2H2-type domain-containing protein n=1 Tax=Mycena albidolilacea TaxID=1033008 RepID=A0AAD7EN68_9AGAR|nr:hypothetical protein DFH08DRAFT_874603 [Mycena albidolilacea]
MPREDSTYTSSPPKPDQDPNRRATCTTCGLTVKRPSDLPRHMLLHAKNKEDFMFQCPFPECGHKTLQKSNLETHIRIHTNARPLQCPVIFSDGLRCNFTSSDPSSLHRHKKRKHEDGE